MAENTKELMTSEPGTTDFAYLSLLEASAEISRLLISNIDFHDAVRKVTDIISKSLLYDRTYICEFTQSDEPYEINLVFLKNRGEDSRVITGREREDLISPEIFKIIRESLTKGEPEIFCRKKKSNLSCISALEKKGIFSVVAIPVCINSSECWGFIGLESLYERCDWDEKFLTIFKDIATALNLFFNMHTQKLELIMAKEQAEEGETYANSLFEQSPLSMAFVSVNGVVEKVNSSFETRFGIENGRISGKFNILTHNKAKELGWDKIFNRFLITEEDNITGIRFNPADFKLNGNPVVFNLHPFFITIKGKIKKIVLVFKDITEELRNESMLRMQMNLAYAILNCSTLKQFLSVISAELSQIMDISSLYTSLLYNKGEYFSVTGHGTNIDRIWTSPLKGSIEGYVLGTNKSHLFKRDEIFRMCKSGEISYPGNIPASWIGVPFDGNSSLAGVIAVINDDNDNAFNEKDISIIELIANETKIFLDKKRTEENTLKITKAITESPTSIVITDRMGIIEYVNPKFTNLTGYSFEEVVGKTPSIMKSGSTPDQVYKNLWLTITSGQEWRGELKNKKKSGEFYWEDISISPVFDDNGYISHYVAVKEDVTDRKLLISELINARDKAQESDRLKTSFIQNISHEIRTPMNGIMGFIELLKDNTLQEAEREKYLDTIKKCGDRMLIIVNDLIDISKIEAGVVKVDKVAFKPSLLLLDLYNFFTPEAEKSGLKISLESEAIENTVIFSDQDKIFAALSNLIKNSIKFTHKGLITVKAELTGRNICFTVSDTGIGIPKEEQSKIFDRFARVEYKSDRSYEGTGLGLSIVKGYAELLGGSVDVNSVSGIGSSFTFTVPSGIELYSQDSSIITDEINSYDINKGNEKMIKVLIVEDEETNRLYLKTLLKKRDYTLLTACNGQEAVEIFSQEPDIKLILMDIRMPVMDGYQATKEIRQLNKDVAIIAQTAYASSADRDRVIAAGCNGYILKPIRKEELLEMIDRFLTE